MFRKIYDVIQACMSIYSGLWFHRIPCVLVWFMLFNTKSTLLYVEVDPALYSVFFFQMYPTAYVFYYIVLNIVVRSYLPGFKEERWFSVVNFSLFLNRFVQMNYLRDTQMSSSQLF